MEMIPLLSARTKAEVIQGCLNEQKKTELVASKKTKYTKYKITFYKTDNMLSYVTEEFKTFLVLTFETAKSEFRE